MIQLQLITPKGLYLKEEVESVHVTTIEGETTILTNHMPIVAMLKVSPCIVTINKEKHYFAIGEGLLQFKDNHMNILTDSIEAQSDIDEERAQAAKDRAMQRLSKISPDIDVARAQLALAKAMNRIKVKHF